MPATPIVCFECGQTGHIKRDCPHGGVYNRRGGAFPAGPGRGRGGYQSRGMDRGKMTCFKCLNKGQSVHECTVHSARQQGRGGASEKSGGHTDRQRNASSQLYSGGLPRASSSQFYGRYVRHADCL
ncbi:MAG: hypothetical protein GY696_21010 [Gammaproteobacteria bacterium]|nr:hypothetical protein [Gammaproteobacteria bacterium]